MPFRFGEADIAERRIDALRREYRRAHEAARRRSDEATRQL